eukprot:scaffold11051_cov165-Amphora_coffeaeformis.AAC.2
MEETSPHHHHCEVFNGKLLALRLIVSRAEIGHFLPHNFPEKWKMCSGMVLYYHTIPAYGPHTLTGNFASHSWVPYHNTAMVADDWMVQHERHYFV